MARCSICNDLTNRDASHGELSFSFAISGRSPSPIKSHACSICRIIFLGIRAAIEESPDAPSQKNDMMHVRCFGVHGGFAETLQVVVTFFDDSPPAHLEYYSLGTDSKFCSSLLVTTLTGLLILSSAEIFRYPPSDQCKHTPALGRRHSLGSFTARCMHAISSILHGIWT